MISYNKKLSTDKEKHNVHTIVYIEEPNGQTWPDGCRLHEIYACILF
jgi:hypothetical protein